MDRQSKEKDRALEQVLETITTANRQQRGRQRWQGVVRQTALDAVGSTTTNTAQVVLTSLQLEAGKWALFARAAIQISSNVGSPTFTGTEAMTARLRIRRTSDFVSLGDLDSDTRSPACVQQSSVSGYYADSMLLFGSVNFDFPVTAQIVVSADETDTTDHIVPWQSGRIMALPF